MVEYEKSVIWEDERVHKILYFLNSLIIKNDQEAELYENGDSYSHYMTNYDSILNYTERSFRIENDLPLTGTLSAELYNVWQRKLADNRFLLDRYVDKNKYYAQMTGKPGVGEELLILNFDHPIFDLENFNFTPIIKVLENDKLGPPPIDIITLASVVKKRNLYRNTFSTFFGNRYENYGIDGGERLSYLANKYLRSLGEPSIPDLSIKLNPLNSDYVRTELERYRLNHPLVAMSIDNLVEDFKELVMSTTHDENSILNYTNVEITTWCYRNNVPLLYVMLHEVDRNKNRVTYNLLYADQTVRLIESFRKVYGYTYLNFIHAGLRVEKIRNAKHFDIVSYEHGVLDDMDLNNFLKIYDEVRAFVKENKHIINLEYAYANYSNFEIVAILFGTFQRMCSAYIDRYSLRNYTDREINDILDSNNLSNLKILKKNTKRNVVEMLDTLLAYRGTEEILKKIIEVIGDDSRLSILKYDLHKGYPNFDETKNRPDPTKATLDNDFSYNSAENTDLSFSSRVIATNDPKQNLLTGEILYDYDKFVEQDKYWGGQNVYSNWWTISKQMARVKNEILSLPFNRLDTKYIGVMTKVDIYSRYIDMLYKLGFLMQYGTEDQSVGSLLNLESKINLNPDQLTYRFDGVDWTPSQLFTLAAAIRSHIDIDNITVYEGEEQTYTKKSRNDPDYDRIKPEYFRFKRLAKLILLEEDQVAYDILDREDGRKFSVGPFSWATIKDLMAFKLTDEEKAYEYFDTTQLLAKRSSKDGLTGAEENELAEHEANNLLIEGVVKRINDDLKEVSVGEYIKAVHIESRNATFFVSYREDYDERIKTSIKTGTSLLDLEDTTYGNNVSLSKREKSFYDIPIPTFNDGLPSSLAFDNIIKAYPTYKMKFLGLGGLIDKVRTSEDLFIGRAWEAISEYFYTDVTVEGDYMEYINSREVLLDGDGVFSEYDADYPYYEADQVVLLNEIYYTCKTNTFTVDEDTNEETLNTNYLEPDATGENLYWRRSTIAPRRNTFQCYFQDQGNPEMLARYEERVLTGSLRKTLGEESYLFQYWKMAQNAFVNSLAKVLAVDEDVFDTDSSYKEGVDLSLLIQTLVSIYIEMRDIAVVFDNKTQPEDGRLIFHDRLVTKAEELGVRDSVTITSIDSDNVVVSFEDKYSETVNISETVIVTAYDSRTTELETGEVEVAQDEFERRSDAVSPVDVIVNEDDFN